MTSEKQKEANKKNSRLAKGKPRDTSKSKFNACKHGILTSTVPIKSRYFKEDEKEFNLLTKDLRTDLQPKGVVESFLVEKIAKHMWTERRICIYEKGITETKLQKTADNEKSFNDFEKATKLQRNMKSDKRITEFELLCGFTSEMLENCELSEFEDYINYYDEKITEEELVKKKKLSIKPTQDEVENHIEKRIDLYKEVKKYLKKELNERIEKEKYGSIVGSDTLEKLSRYQTTNQKQLFQCLSELERIQRRRQKEYVPPPINVNVQENGFVS